ncbi:acetyltransferase [Virgibacillus necropolis]|uniref:Acetyltransferase n=1 Tax=Virgibacillus necropolis TaxID=163877 RepID=A0A221M9B7_9BACI|nr:acetyltransferase [Virgibacillus necropolis]ASN04233.1 acetyltransferase [Virgibacillus necropolis]
MTDLIIIGAGGHSKVVQDIVAANTDLDLYAIVDDAFDETNEADGIIHANTSLLDSLNIERYKFCIAIGNNVVRKNLFDRFNMPIERYVKLVHPSAIISKFAKIGYGTVVMPNAVINADTIIGNHCIVNTNAVVEHDNNLDDYVHVSPSATLSGVVSVGEGTHIGSGAVVIPLKSIGSWTTIGAGAVVVNDISGNVTVVGVPAREILTKGDEVNE